jgi:tetratricopeptide (TPR) repeat protein
VERPSKKQYVAVMAAFAASLLAKAMLVTLPVVLILLDFWPLQRLAWPPTWNGLQTSVREKAPLLIMSAISSVVTFIAQSSYGAVTSLNRLSLSSRLENAAIVYVAYLTKFFVPHKLALLYPYKAATAAALVTACSLLGTVTAICLLNARRKPYLCLGWFWYLLTLLPVIGIVQIGNQSMADRYTYVPLVGISLMIAYLSVDIAGTNSGLRTVAGVLGAVALLILGSVTYVQAGYWKDSRTAFEHTLAVTENNYIIHNNLGVVLVRQISFDDGLRHYAEAIRLKPDYALAHANLGHAFLLKGQSDDALRELELALQLKPDIAIAHEDIGIQLASQGKFRQALPHLTEAVRLSPWNADNHSNFCYVLQRMDRVAEAIDQCGAALRLNPAHIEARYNLGTAFASAGRRAEAVKEFSTILGTRPEHADARAALTKLQ